MRSWRALLYWIVRTLDHLLGVLGRGFHGRHAGAVLAGHRFHQRAVDLHASRGAAAARRGWPRGLGS